MSVKKVLISGICKECGYPFTFLSGNGRKRTQCDVCREKCKKKRSKAYNKKWRKTGRGLESHRAQADRHQARARAELRDNYIKAQLRITTGIAFPDIPPALVEEKRKQLYVRRLYLKAKKEIEK